MSGDARDKIARYLGVGRTTIERAERVVEAAEAEPDEYGHLVEQMDRSGKIAGAFRRLQILKQARDLDEKPPDFPSGKFHVIVADSPWRYEGSGTLPYPQCRSIRSGSFQLAALQRTMRFFGFGLPIPISV